MEFLALAGRVILSLAVVLVLLWLASRGVRRNQRRSTRGVDVDVLARQPLAQRASVAVVKVGDRALVLGVTESRVDLLSDQPLESLLTVSAPESAPAPSTEPGFADSTESLMPKQPRAHITAPAKGPLAGSALSPATWSKALDAVREMTVRK
jgi:flagellar protein FliO/FliZ